MEKFSSHQEVAKQAAEPTPAPVAEKESSNQQELWWQQYSKTGEFGGEEPAQEKMTALVELVMQALSQDNQELLREIPSIVKNIIRHQGQQNQDLPLNEQISSANLPVKNMSNLWTAHELVTHGLGIERALELAQRANLFDHQLSETEIKQLIDDWQETHTRPTNKLYSLRPVIDFYHQQNRHLKVH